MFGTRSLSTHEGHRRLVEATLSSNSKLIDRVSTDNRNIRSMHGTDYLGRTGSISQSNLDDHQILEEEKVSDGV